MPICVSPLFTKSESFELDVRSRSFEPRFRYLPSRQNRFLVERFHPGCVQLEETGGQQQVYTFFD